MKLPYYIISDVMAKIVDGKVTIEINNPEAVESFNDAKTCANEGWYSNQIALLELVRQRRVDKQIPLTSDSVDPPSRLRLGGGFLQLEKTISGRRIVVSKRRSEGLRSGMLCESGGIHDKEDYILMMILELAEIARYTDDTLYIPRLTRFFDYGQQDLDYYNKELESEVIREAREIGIEGHECCYINVISHTLASSVTVIYNGKPSIYGEVVSEVDSSSLEFVGVVEYDMRGVDVEELKYQDTERPSKEEDKQLRATAIIDLQEDLVQLWPEVDYPICPSQMGEPEPTELVDVLHTIDLARTGGRYANEKLCAILEKLPSLGSGFLLGAHFEPILRKKCRA